jgi:hypothetical protein
MGVRPGFAVDDKRCCAQLAFVATTKASALRRIHSTVHAPADVAARALALQRRAESERAIVAE